MVVRWLNDPMKQLNNPSIPPTMRGVQLTAYDGKPESLTVTEKPVPRPGQSQVFVGMAAAPINPSDLAFLRGLYGVGSRWRIH